MVDTSKPFYSNPFVIAFVFGAMALTAMPFLQKKFLKAAPPLGPLPSFSLPDLNSGELMNAGDLKDTIWIVSFVPSRCDAACQERQRDFGRATSHVQDLKKIRLLRFVAPESAILLSPAPQIISLKAAGPSLTDLESGLAGLWNNQGSGTGPQGPLTDWKTFVVVDDLGQVRGFWPDDISGFGNAVNAARLLAKLKTPPAQDQPSPQHAR
jgi:hypothetical protein